MSKCTDDLTLREIRELRSLFAAPAKTAGHSMRIGDPVLIRTVTMTYTGRIADVTDSDILLEDAAWIGDTGRYHEALAEGTLSEVEPYPDRVIVSRGALVDVAPWDHPLPREPK